MWIKKSSDDLAIGLLARRAARAAWVFCFAYLLFVAAMPCGVFNIMPSARVVAALLAAAVLWGWYCQEQDRQARAKIMVCEQCGTKFTQPVNSCACGGNPVALSQMKWIADPPPPATPSPAIQPVASEEPASAPTAQNPLRV